MFRIRNCHRRRGMAVLMVLLLLSLTLGLCYAAIRGQYSAGTIQRNSDRRATARQAAVTGMTMALKKMQRSDWGGVGTSLSGALDSYTTFLTTYTAGDTRLGSADPDQPYRVTLLATGYAVDFEHPQSIATYQIQAVVRLIPRALAAEPSDWTAMSGYTLYQTKINTTDIDIPCRFTGPARLQGSLKVALDYPNSTNARTLYLSDLNKMRQNGMSDYRTFNGPVYLPFTGQDPKYFAWLTSSTAGLGVTAVDTPAQQAVTNWVKPGSPGGYRIYPGGLAYVVQPVADTLQATTLGPDPTSNPLGLFYCDGTLTINNNVTVQGSLFCGADIQFKGTNIVVQPVALPLLGTNPVKLAAISCQNATVNNGGGGQVTGLMAVFGAFLIEQGSQNMAFTLTGQLATSTLTVQQRTEWNLNWNSYRTLFLAQLQGNPQTAVKYFPVWMGNQGRNPAPKFVFAPKARRLLTIGRPPTTRSSWRTRPTAGCGGTCWCGPRIPSRVLHCCRVGQSRALSHHAAGRWACASLVPPYGLNLQGKGK